VNAGRDKLLSDLASIVAASHDRGTSLREIAELLRAYGGYRWVGLYDVDHKAGVVRNIVWSGPGPPEYPTFPVTKGLTSAVIAEKRTLNVGNVAADSRYLTALGSTQSEIIVPVFDDRKVVVGTIDVESELANDFDGKAELLLQACADAIKPLWKF
jgi:L-methionine (R)-S-oxide reductase